MSKIWEWIKSLFGKKIKPQPKPDEVTPKPIRLVHGEPCGVPMCDKSNREKGQERVYRIGPFPDFRILAIDGGHNSFLDNFAMDAVRLENGYIVVDDVAHSGVVYIFDHFAVKTYKDVTTTNPLKLDGVSKDTFRVYWKSCKNV